MCRQSSLLRQTFQGYQNYYVPKCSVIPSDSETGDWKFLVFHPVLGVPFRPLNHETALFCYNTMCNLSLINRKHSVNNNTKRSCGRNEVSTCRTYGRHGCRVDTNFLMYEHICIHTTDINFVFQKPRETALLRCV